MSRGSKAAPHSRSSRYRITPRCSPSPPQASWKRENFQKNVSFFTVSTTIYLDYPYLAFNHVSISKFGRLKVQMPFRFGLCVYRYFPCALKTSLRREWLEATGVRANVEFSPEGSFTLSLQELSCSCFKLCRSHVHRLLHFFGRRLNEVGVNVVAEALLSEDPAHQVEGRAGAAHPRAPGVETGSWGTLEMGHCPSPVRNVSAAIKSVKTRR